MKLCFTASAFLGAAVVLNGSALVVNAQGKMVKMCLFYEHPSGHARSDPIINQQCPSGHVHTFYGPLGFHPDTTYKDLIDTPPELSTSPYVENQSLYWHPSIYEVTEDGDGTKTFTRVSNLETSPYYRWDNSVKPKTEAFPPRFRMIAASDDPGADGGGGDGFKAMFTECCHNGVNGEEDCVEWDRLEFPQQACDFLSIALAMPTCWNGELGIAKDHKSHMAYTLNGQVAGECPAGFGRRLPQVQLFVRVPNYKGGKYQLSDGRSQFHVDFFNGWKEGKLQEIIDNCPVHPDQEIDEYNPPCDCTPDGESGVNFVTTNDKVARPVCDSDVRRLIIDEATDVTTSLPLDECQGARVIEKSWGKLNANLFRCEVTTEEEPEGAEEESEGEFEEEPDGESEEEPGGESEEEPEGESEEEPDGESEEEPDVESEEEPEGDSEEEPEGESEEELEGASEKRWVVCGRGVGDGLRACPGGDMKLVFADEEHEVRCCKDGEEGEGWRHKCRDMQKYNNVFGKSKIDGACHKENFYDAYEICSSSGGRLCTKDEVLNSCTKGTGCSHDRELVWTCSGEEAACSHCNECCSGVCHGEGFCMGSPGDES